MVGFVQTTEGNWLQLAVVGAAIWAFRPDDGSNVFEAHDEDGAVELIGLKNQKLGIAYMSDWREALRLAGGAQAA